jgi:hypothetical protein
MTLARLGRLTEAESLLVENVPKLPPREARSRKAVRFVADFYAGWNRVRPGDPARLERAAEWRRRLESSAAAVAR